MGLKRSTRWCCSVFTLSLLVWVFTGELGIYYLYSVWWVWPHPPWPSQEVMIQHYSDNDLHYFTSGIGKTPSNVDRIGNGRQFGLLRMILISDPHIMCTCDRDEPWLARWDADRYLQKSFSYLFSALTPSPGTPSHITPHTVVVLMGDVFSSGFRATDKEWSDYLKCLHTTLSLKSIMNDVIVAMGDNDIGGEGRDHMSKTVVERYKESFGAMNSVVTVGGVQLIKLTTVCFINPSPKTQPESDCRQSLTKFLNDFNAARPSTSTNTSNINILLSHVPLNALQSTTNIKTKILSSLRPSYVFSGHIHHEKYTTHSLVLEKHSLHNDDDETLDQGFTHEITVPTASYRMGERRMGIGVAVIGESGDMGYRVLWLPPRYPFLIVYLIHAVLFVCALVVLCTFKRKCFY